MNLILLLLYEYNLDVIGGKSENEGVFRAEMGVACNSGHSMA